MTDDTATILQAFEHAPVAMMVTKERVITACNEKFCTIFGYPREKLLGQSIRMLYPSDDDFVRMGELGPKRMQTTGESDDLRVMTRADGTLFWVRGQGRSMTPNAPFAHTIWCFEDLSSARPMLDLTKRERQVAMLVVEGQSAKEIARMLGISPRTVEAHRAKLLEKYHVKTTGELISKLSSSPQLET